MADLDQIFVPFPDTASSAQAQAQADRIWEAIEAQLVLYCYDHDGMLVSKATLRQRVSAVIKGLLDELAAERARERQLAMEVAEIQSRLRDLLAEQEQMRADVERCRKAEIEHDQWRAAMQALSPGDNPDKTVAEVENWHFEMRRKLREQSKAIGAMTAELAALRAAVADAVAILEHQPVNTPQLVQAFLRTHAAAIEAATKEDGHVG